MYTQFRDTYISKFDKITSNRVQPIKLIENI